MLRFASEIYFGLELLEQSHQQCLTRANVELQHKNGKQHLETATYRPRQRVTL